MSEVAELHVLPHEHTGTWLVEIGPGSPALSWHGTADEAELAAKRHAAARGARRVYLHDRYKRVRPVPLGTTRER